MAKQKKIEPVAECQRGDEASAKAVPSVLGRMREFIERACEGDETALGVIRELLRQDPDLFVRSMGGDLANEAERCLVRKTAGKNLAFREALETKLKMLREELAGPSPSPIERLLVDRVVACWLQLSHADLLIAQAERITLQQGNYHQRQQDRAHRRYLSAIKTLATVRRLALPIRVNVNVAGKVETTVAQQPAATRPRWTEACAN